MSTFNRYLGVPGAGPSDGRGSIPNSQPLTQEERAFRPEALRILQEHAQERPQERSECRKNGDRPCPWVSCKHHLYLDVNPDTGTITLNFPDKEVWELTESCALDVIERQAGWDPRTGRSEPMSLEQAGKRVGLTKPSVVAMSHGFAKRMRSHI